MASRVDTLIAGQGLAGSLLAWQLLQRGESVLVVDDQGPAAASRVAAGMINPLAGRRLALYPNTALYLEEAYATYAELAEAFGKPFFFPVPIHRYFQNEAEQTRHEERRQDPEFAPYLGEQLDGGFVTLGGGWVDVPALLKSIRDWLSTAGYLRKATIDYNELQVSADSVLWGDVEAQRVIFCEGWRGARNPWFDWLPWDPVKGEILSVQGDALQRDRILNRGKWLVPGPENSFRAGATYDREAFDDLPTEAGNAEILAGLRVLLPGETLQITDRQAGVRPGTRTQHPFLGRHPGYNPLAILNGFGSKGTLLIPRLAKLFCDHLSKGYSLPSNMDVRALWKS